MTQTTDKIPLNIILIGKAGHGKSATGNSILGRTAFKQYPHLRSGTKVVTDASAQQGQFDIKVVDGPGLEVTNQEGVINKEQMFENMAKALRMCKGGIQAFVLVVKFWFRYTEEDRKAIYDLKQIFGENYLKHRGIIVVTGGYCFSGQMEANGTPGKTFKEWCREQDNVLGNLIEECSPRVVLFNNLPTSEEEQTRQRNELLFHAGQFLKVKASDTTEHFQTNAQERSKCIKDSKQIILEETIQKRIDMLSAERRQLSIDSSLEDVDTLDACITGVFMEIGEEALQEESLQQFIGSLEELRTTTEDLRRAIRESLSAKKAKALYTTKHYHTYAQVRDKLIKESKQKMLEETIQTRIDMLSAELRQLSMDSSLEDVDTLDARITGVFMEIGEEALQEESLQQFIGSLGELRTTTEELSRAIQEKNLSAMKSNLIEECIPRVVLFNNLSKCEEEERRQRNELPFHAGELQKIKDLDTTEHFQTFAQVRDKFNKDSKQKILEETILKRIDLLSAELGRLSIDSSLEDVDKLDARITDVYTEIGEESLQEKSMQQLIGRLKRLRATTEKLRRTIQDKILSAMKPNLIAECSPRVVLFNDLPTSEEEQTRQRNELLFHAGQLQKVDTGDVPCYWKSQPARCVKQNYPYKHSKPALQDEKTVIGAVSLQVDATASTSSNSEDIKSQNIVKLVVTSATQTSFDSETTSSPQRSPTLQDSEIQVNTDNQKTESNDSRDIKADTIQKISAELQKPKVTTKKIKVSPVSKIKQESDTALKKERKEIDADSISERFTLKVKDNPNQPRKSIKERMGRAPVSRPVVSHSLEESDSESSSDLDNSIENIVKEISRQKAEESLIKKRAGEEKAKQRGASFAVIKEQTLLPSADKKMSYPASDKETRTVQKNVHSPESRSKAYVTATKKVKHVPAAVNRSSSSSEESDSRLTRQANANALEMAEKREQCVKKRFVNVDYDSDDCICSRVEEPFKLHVRVRLGKSTSLHKSSSDPRLLSKTKKCGSEPVSTKVDSGTVILVRSFIMLKSSSSEDEQASLTEMKVKTLEEIRLEKMKIMAQKSEQKLSTHKEFRSTPVCKMVHRTDIIPLNLILVGKTGHGKSSTGNSIVGGKAFQTSLNTTSETKEVTHAWGEHGRYEIKVVDGPGLEDTDLDAVKNKEQACENMAKALMMCNGGVHAFVFVFKIGTRYTEEERKSISDLKQIFGDNYLKDHGIIVMTGGDSFSAQMEEDDTSGKIFKEWCRDQDNIFGNLIEECSPRVVLFNNLSKSEEEQTRQRNELLFHAGQLQKEKGFYTTEHFQKYAQVRRKFINDSKQKILEETIQKRIYLLSAELGRLSIDSSLEDVDKLDVRITDVFMEIGEESLQEESMQQLIASLKRLRTTTEELRKAIQEKNLAAMEAKLVAMSQHQEELKETGKIPWGRIAACIGIGLVGAAAVAGGVTAIVLSGGTLAPVVLSLCKPLLDGAVAYLSNKFEQQ